jgi:hypothetical protein
LNNLPEYNINTNVVIKGEKTMPIHPSDLEQLGQGVSEKPT